MGIAELHTSSHKLIIRSIFHFYGDASNENLSFQIAKDIETHWNEPIGTVRIKKNSFEVFFSIVGKYDPELLPETVWYNTNPSMNFFRIEEFSMNHISFVDGIRSNTGYFKLDNLLNNSTTAAHEYGHGLGLDHPSILDIRGQGQPGIMYPRGTICDPEFQYDALALPLKPGGTLNPFTRKVLPSDIDDLRLDRLSFDRRGFATIGGFSSLYHQKHQL